LTNMANSVWRAIVVVQEAATTGEIQHCQANQGRANPAQSGARQSWTQLLHLSIRVH
jgi:hypothetical protein